MSETSPPARPPELVGLETRRLRDALARRLFDATPQPVRVGRFVVLDAIGRGGMGVVYAAYDPTLDRRVALKLLHPAHAGGVGRDAENRLEREATAVAKLGHPNVVTVHEIGCVEDDEGESFTYMAMEFVEGGDLGRWASEQEVGERDRIARIVELLVQAARGLLAAHDAGLVHRDIKPSNLLIGRDGRLRVADFGLVRDVGEGDPAARSASLAAPAGEPAPASQRSTAEVAGTPAYMAPEQLDGKSDARSDQWSLCATFWEVVYGSRPWPARTLAALREAYAQRVSPQGAAGADAPAWLRRVLLRGLSIDARARFAGLGELLAALERGRRPPRWRAGAFGLVLGGITMGGVWWVAQTPGDTAASTCPDPRAELDGIWGDAEKAALTSAIQRSDAASAEETSARIFADLDDWAAAWADHRRDACESPFSEPQLQADRSACLSRARDDLGIAARLLGDGDRQTLRRAPLLLAALPSPAACDDRESLEVAGGARLSSPSVQAVLEHLSTATLMSAAGRVDEERAAATAGRDAADAADLPALRGRASLQLATLSYRAGEIDEAIVLARAALADAERSDATDLAIGAWTRLGWAAIKQKRTEDVAFYGERALSWAERPNVDPTDVAHAHTMLGQGHLEAARPAEAVVELEAARELLEDRFGPTYVHVGRVLVSLVTPYQLVGRSDEALAAAHRALDIFEATYGPSHPETAIMRVRVAGQELDRGEIETALALSRSALVVLEANEGYRSEHRVAALGILASAAQKLGRIDDAERWRSEAVAVSARELGPDAAPTIEARFGLVSLLHGAERYAEAKSALEAILPHVETLHPVNRAIFQQAMGETELALGNADEADRWATSGLAAAREVLGEDAAAMIGFLGLAGRTAAAQRRVGAARRLLGDALALAKRHESPASTTASIEEALAELDDGKPEHVAEPLSGAADGVDRGPP